MDLEELKRNALEMEPDSRERYLGLTALFTHRAEQCLGTYLAKFGSRKPIKFGISQSPLFSARAIHGDKFDEIIVHRGLISGLYNYFELLWMDSTYSPAAGDGKTTQDSRCTELKQAILSGSPSTPLALKLSENSGRYLVDPVVDPRRSKVAMFQLRSALDFILMHELMHIWNGHVSLQHALYQQNSINEADPENHLFKPRENQWLEADADMSAAIEALDLIAHQNIRNETGVGYRYFEDTYGDKATEVIMGMASVHSIFSLMETTMITDEQKSRYPSPFNRSVISLMGADLFGNGRFQHYDAGNLPKNGAPPPPTFGFAAIGHAIGTYRHFLGLPEMETAEFVARGKEGAEYFKVLATEVGSVTNTALKAHRRSPSALTPIAPVVPIGKSRS